MTSYDDARENVVWGAADAFLSNNLDDLLDEIFERVEEDGDDPADVVSDVVSDWISRISVSDEVHEYIYEQIDDETMYSSDCMEIITDYGFSESLAAAVEMGAIPAGSQAVEHGCRTCGGCDLTDTTESAVASAVLTLNMPDDDTMQDEIIRQIQECSSYLERVAEYENRNRDSVDEEDDEEDECDERDDDEGECDERDDDEGKCDGNEREGDA